VVNVNRLPWLNQHNIHTIVCVAGKDDVTIKPEIYASKRVYQWEIMDHTSQVLDFEPVIQQIEESMQYGAVLVNCAVGISRSASFVIAYLMKTQYMSFHDAFVAVTPLPI